MNDSKVPADQQKLSDEVGELAGETRGPERYVVSAISKQILSNGAVESALLSFSIDTAETERKMKKLATAQLWLAGAQVLLAFVSIVLAIVIASNHK